MPSAHSLDDEGLTYEQAELLYAILWDLTYTKTTNRCCPVCGNAFGLSVEGNSATVFCRTDGCLYKTLDYKADVQ